MGTRRTSYEEQAALSPLLLLPEVEALERQPQSQSWTHMPGGQGRPPPLPLSDLVAHSLPWTPLPANCYVTDMLSSWLGHCILGPLCYSS